MFTKMKRSQTKLFTTLILSLVLFCDLRICDENVSQLQQINCLPTVQDCSNSQQNNEDLNSEKDKNHDLSDSELDLGYQSTLNVPLLKPGEHGEDIAVKVSRVNRGQAGNLCDSDSDCEIELNCVTISFNDSPLLSSTINDQTQHHICAMITDDKTEPLHNLECPQDSQIAHYQSEQKRLSFCKCSSPNDTCQNDQSQHQCSNKVYLTPGNCCVDCTEYEKTTNNKLTPNLSKDHKISNLPSAGSKSCAFTDMNGNRFNYNHGEIFLKYQKLLSFKNEIIDKISCVECRCNDGAQMCNNTAKTECPNGQNCAVFDLNKPFDTSVCCPPCASCVHDKSIHEHGTNWISSSSKCESCSCNNSKILCHQLTCDPVLECNENEIENTDDCCPKCVCKPQLQCPFGKASNNGTETCVCLQEPTESNDPTVYSTDSPVDKTKLSFSKSYLEIVLLCSVVAISLVFIIFGIFALYLYFCKPSQLPNHSSSRTDSSDKRNSDRLLPNSI